MNDRAALVELMRVKVLFQQRTIAAVIRGPFHHQEAVKAEDQGQSHGGTN